MGPCVTLCHDGIRSSLQGSCVEKRRSSQHRPGPSTQHLRRPMRWRIQMETRLRPDGSNARRYSKERTRPHRRRNGQGCARHGRGVNDGLSGEERGRLEHREERRLDGPPLQHPLPPHISRQHRDSIAVVRAHIQLAGRGRECVTYDSMTYDSMTCDSMTYGI